MSASTSAQPSGPRIVERCDALARLSEDPAGLTRIFLSKEQRAANELVLGWMKEAGMSATNYDGWPLFSYGFRPLISSMTVCR